MQEANAPGVPLNAARVRNFDNLRPQGRKPRIPNPERDWSAIRLASARRGGSWRSLFSTGRARRARFRRGSTCKRAKSGQIWETRRCGGAWPPFSPRQFFGRSGGYCGLRAQPKNNVVVGPGKQKVKWTPATAV